MRVRGIWGRKKWKSVVLLFLRDDVKGDKNGIMIYLIFF